MTVTLQDNAIIHTILRDEKHFSKSYICSQSKYYIKLSIHLIEDFKIATIFLVKRTRLTF